MKYPKIVHVRWVDSTAHTGWRKSTVSYKDDDLMCHTAGHLVREDKDSIVISASATNMGNDNFEFNNTMVIPRSALRGRIQVLRK